MLPRRRQELAAVVLAMRELSALIAHAEVTGQRQSVIRRLRQQLSILRSHYLVLSSRL